MKFVLASRNAHKITEMKQLLSKLQRDDIELLSLDDIGFFGEIEETGNTFEENALIKASVPASQGYIGIADDSGLSVDALNGSPGVYSARFAGEPCDDAANNQKLLNLLTDVSERSAQFVSVIAAVAPSRERILVRGECPGEILFELQGNGGFGYDPLFYYAPLQKTFAQLSSEEKNQISHRAAAFRKFAHELPDFIDRVQERNQYDK